MSSSAPIEPRPRGRWHSRAFIVLEALLPFFASRWASRRVATPSGQDLDELTARYQSLLLRRPDLAADVDDLVALDWLRSGSLEAKAVAILQGVAILGAVLVGVEVVTWGNLTLFQRVCFVLSDAYGLAAFYQGIHAVRPKVNLVYTTDDIEAEAMSVGDTSRWGWIRRRPPARPSAPRRLAYVQGNLAIRTRLSNDIESALGSARNSTLLAAATLLPYVLGGIESAIWSLTRACGIR